MSKRKSDSSIAPSDVETEDQNKPPLTRSNSDKRLRKYESENYFSELSQNNSKKELVSPNSSNDAYNCPGAPRILLNNQGVNVDPANEMIPRVNALLAPETYLRTPPTFKSKVYVNIGKEEYRGINIFDKLSDEMILEVFHYLPRHLMCVCALVCRRWARLVCDHSLWRRLNLENKCIKPGVLRIVLERGVEVLRANKCEVMGDFQSTVLGNPDPRSSPLTENRMYRLQLLDLSMTNVNTHLVEDMLCFCPKLRRISLENIPVSELLLMNLGQNSPNLQTINLAMCEGVTGDGMKAIFRGCNRLVELNCSWTSMSAKDIRKTLRNLPKQLRELNMAGYRENMNDEGVVTILERCPQLRVLDISDSTQVSDDSIEMIPSELKSLHTLSLSRCYRVNTGTIINLSRSPSLEAINVFGLLRDPSLAVLEEHMSQFKINKDPFSCIARPTPFHSKKHLMWNVSPTEGPPLDMDTYS